MKHWILRMPFWVLPCSLVGIALLVLTNLMLPLVGLRSSEALRDLRIEEQHWRRHVLHLQRWQLSREQRPVDQEPDDIRLAVLESLRGSADLKGVHLDSLGVDQAQTLAGAENVNTLRVTLSARVTRIGHLLVLFDRLKMDVPGWPAELRGCHLSRDDEDQGIDVACVYDIYHWRDVLVGDLPGVDR